MYPLRKIKRNHKQMPSQLKIYINKGKMQSKIIVGQFLINQRCLRLFRIKVKTKSSLIHLIQILRL